MNYRLQALIVHNFVPHIRYIILWGIQFVVLLRRSQDGIQEAKVGGNEDDRTRQHAAQEDVVLRLVSLEHHLTFYAAGELR